MAALDRFLALLQPNRRVLIAAGAIVAVVALLLFWRVAPAPACDRITFEGTPFMVCTYNSQADELRLVWQRKGGNALRSFEALEEDLGQETSRVRFAMNVGMFNSEGSPIGVHVERGVALRPLNRSDGPGNFHMKPNGVVSVDADGLVHVETTDQYAARSPEPYWASQSGPMLVIDGTLHPAIKGDGPSRVIRNGVGKRDGNTLIFAISEAPVSFGRFARLFRDQLKCDNALFLDGAVSSLWIPRTGRRDAGYPIGPMVVVLDADDLRLRKRDD
jgi:uncharacterized protein YigE (DUF2233 family)